VLRRTALIAQPTARGPYASSAGFMRGRDRRLHDIVVTLIVLFASAENYRPSFYELKLLFNPRVRAMVGTGTAAGATAPASPRSAVPTGCRSGDGARFANRCHSSP
jgi:hypothetical protein